MRAYEEASAVAARAPPGRRTIEIDTDIPRMVDEAEAVLLADESSGIYQRAGALVRVIRPAEADGGEVCREGGTLLIQAVSDAALRERCAGASVWGTQPTPTSPHGVLRPPP